MRADRVREAMEHLLRSSSASERQEIAGKIDELRKEIDKVNTERKLLAKTKEDLETALEAVKGTDIAEDPLAEVVLRLSIDEVGEKIAVLRPNNLLAEKAGLQRRLNFLLLRWRGAEEVMRRLGGRDGR